MALGELLPVPEMPPEERKGQPLLRTLYLDKLEKGHHESEWTGWPRMMMMAFNLSRSFLFQISPHVLSFPAGSLDYLPYSFNSPIVSALFTAHEGAFPE